MTTPSGTPAQRPEPDQSAEVFRGDITPLRSLAGSVRTAKIRLAPPALVPISEQDWQEAVSLLGEMLVPLLERHSRAQKAA